MADGIRMASENTARHSGGSYLTIRYNDIIHPQKQDERTGEEIVDDIIHRAGLKVV